VQVTVTKASQATLIGHLVDAYNLFYGYTKY
jgi:hypothetical protein